MKLKKWISGVLCCSILFSTQLTVSPFRTKAASVSNKAATIGTVNLTGDSGFDSDSIMNDEDSQWRWLSYPESRMVMNYGKRNDAKYDGGISAVLCNVVKNVDFAECLRVTGNTTKLEGVEPSSFNATAMIDYTYMLNGLRIDMGNPVAIKDGTIKKSADTDVTVYNKRNKTRIAKDSIRSE